MIRLDGVGFSYGAHCVLDGVSATIERGELVCLVGVNGAGKSTLLQLIAGLLRPGAGRVRCAGLDPAAAPRRQVARHIALVPQSYQLAFPFTVGEVVLMGRYAHAPRGLLGLERPADVNAADRAMRRCDVRELADRRFDAISGGERRRALLAQAFCQETELILLDEPTSSLDPAHAITFFEALRAQTHQQGATALVVTHDLNLAARFADRVLVLDGERLAADGTPAEVLASPAAAAAFGVTLHVGTLPGSGARFVVPDRAGEP